MKPHQHRWKPLALEALGYWEKRDCPGDGVYFQGRVEICDDALCMTMRFICDDPRLQIVEVTERRPA